MHNEPEAAALQPECYTRHANIDAHIAGSKGWRSAILGIIFALVLQIGTFIYFYGRLTQMVEINTNRLTCLEDMHPRVSK